MSRKYKKARKGFFKLENPGKYRGDPNRLIFRSGLEYKLFKFLDRTPSIIEWASDGLDWNGFSTGGTNFIPYFDPVTQKFRRYFYDVWAIVKDRQGNLQTWITEVKSTMLNGRLLRRSVKSEDSVFKF